MSYEMLIGLEIKDDEIYNSYRKAMKPILSSYGGDFGYDFRISEVLKSQNKGEINRVFTLNFPDKNNMKHFFQIKNM